jgi:L-ascorbate metabolism protein UlaG (beta-lactamase superfamily)
LLRQLTFTATDLDGVAELDRRFAAADLAAPWVQEFFIGAYESLLRHLPAAAPAIAVPYNAGTLIATANHKLVGIDLALIEDYYGGADRAIPAALYERLVDRLVDRLDLLIVSHGHGDHCWIRLIEAMLLRGKTVIVPAGIQGSFGKTIPPGCRGVADGESFWFDGLHLSFRFSVHAYDNGRGVRMITTRLWDGHRSILHTADADSTNPAGFFYDDRYPTDVLLFKVGGVSPVLHDNEEMERTIDLVAPRRLILPMHLNELGHRGTDACRAYAEVHGWLDRYRRRGRLGERRFAVLFGNRVVRQ